MLTRSLPSEASETLTREAPIQASSWNAERRTFEVVLSAGSSVVRYDHAGPYDEILDLRGASAPPLLPLLNSHNRFDLDARLGDVSKVRLVRGELVGIARLSRHAPMAQRVAAELGDGTRFGVSIGYHVTAWAERVNPTTKRREKAATAFELLEASLVAIPADQAATTRSVSMDPEETTTTPSAPAPSAAVPIVPSPPTAPAAATRAAINVEIRSIA